MQVNTDLPTVTDHPLPQPDLAAVLIPLARSVSLEDAQLTSTRKIVPLNHHEFGYLFRFALVKDYHTGVLALKR